MQTVTTHAPADCPVCDAPVVLASTAVLSELVTCRDCGTALEVTSLEPPQVIEAPTEEEDWGQ